MTGLDRLHEIAEDVGRTAWLRELGAALNETADAIEREAYDISGRESDVLGWVEKNGGLEAVKERTMPEDMSWPFYEHGEPVRIGGYWQQDGFDESVTYVDSISFAEDGVRLGNDYHEVFYRYGERVKWLAPKVLDADGDANGDELVIGALEDGGHTVACRYADVGDGIPVHGMWSPSDLTHQRPDSWERWRSDLESDALGYAQDAYHGLETSIDFDGFVRRAKALAERERGE